MHIFVSGATGFIGSRLALRLAENGHTVHALYRDDRKSGVIKHPRILLFKGDILNPESLKKAMDGCSQAFHTAAFARVWDRDVASIYRQNIQGTMNVVNSGLWAGVERFVCTSTAGVLGPSALSSFVDETTPLRDHYFTDYEASKAIMETTVRTLVQTGADIVIVNPSRVYGPGILNDSNGVTRMIRQYRMGKWRIIPGDGSSIGNYVYIDDVVTGHILAMEKGKRGERYILGGENLSYNDFFRILSELTGNQYFMFRMPLGLMEMIAGALLGGAKLAGTNPPITPALIRKYHHHWNVDSGYAVRELGYHPVDFRTGAGLTLEWLAQNGSI